MIDDRIMQNCVNHIKTGEIHKETAVVELLDTYYRECIDDLDDENDSYPDELTIPLAERRFGIYEALLWLANEQYDFNAEYDGESALTLAVGYADAPMTSFLIRSGADANKWPDMDELPDIPRSNYYLEDIDIQYLNELCPRTEKYIKALMETARVLLEEGGTGSFKGISRFTADAEKRLITIADYKCEY